jgi:hypothetical protein
MNRTYVEDRAMDEPGRDPAADLMVDGNAVAGTLAAAFGDDVTAMPGQCAHCGTVSMIGVLHAYVRGPGIVLRCPVCHGVVIRAVERRGATYVDAQGMRYLRFERSTLTEG